LGFVDTTKGDFMDIHRKRVLIEISAGVVDTVHSHTEAYIKRPDRHRTHYYTNFSHASIHRLRRLARRLHAEGATVFGELDSDTLDFTCAIEVQPDEFIRRGTPWYVGVGKE